jgi:nitroimidazol reductase NimA-like FMN-containing flavoprotein (pyridoxamine 5'-phosphate oxidase superfamily)
MQDGRISSGDPASSSPAGSARRVVQRLDEAECLRLLGIRGLGRLVYNSRYGPMALPVEYAVHEGSIVFRTTQDTFTDEDLRTGIAHAEYHVALEVDQIDLATREGWTVLIRGAAHHLDTEAERASILSTGVEPWIEGEPEHAIRINPTRIWGHRIRLQLAPVLRFRRQWPTSPADRSPAIPAGR